MQHAANIITSVRIALVFPLFFFTLLAATSPTCHVVALITLGAIIASDFLDGLVARRYGTVTDLGKDIDPFADKLVDAAAYIGLLLIYPHWVLGVLTFLVTIRHAAVTQLRGFAHRFRITIPARRSGKLRTAFSYGLIFFLLARIRSAGNPPYWFAELLHTAPTWLPDVAIGVLIVLTLWSLTDYLWQHGTLIKRYSSAPNG